MRTHQWKRKNNGSHERYDAKDISALLLVLDALMDNGVYQIAYPILYSCILYLQQDLLTALLRGMATDETALKLN